MIHSKKAAYKLFRTLRKQKKHKKTIEKQIERFDLTDRLEGHKVKPGRARRWVKGWMEKEKRGKQNET